jgi:hypothetical protein
MSPVSLLRFLHSLLGRTAADLLNPPPPLSTDSTHSPPFQPQTKVEPSSTRVQTTHQPPLSGSLLSLLAFVTVIQCAFGCWLLVGRQLPPFPLFVARSNCNRNSWSCTAAAAAAAAAAAYASSLATAGTAALRRLCQSCDRRLKRPRNQRLCGVCHCSFTPAAAGLAGQERGVNSPQAQIPALNY